MDNSATTLHQLRQIRNFSNLGILLDRQIRLVAVGPTTIDRAVEAFAESDLWAKPKDAVA